jgi:hypothetical protein
MRLAHAHADKTWASGLLVLAEDYRHRARLDEARADEPRDDGVAQNGDPSAVAAVA